MFKVVLYSPEIPGNTGSIGRTCVGLDCELQLIRPCGFDLDEKALRRAGLDYWKFVHLKIFENWNEFLEKEKPERLHFFSSNTTQNYFECDFKKNDYLIFGPESTGLPKDFHENYKGHFYKMPLFSQHIRSLNLANAATAILYEGLRQCQYGVK